MINFKTIIKSYFYLLILIGYQTIHSSAAASLVKPANTIGTFTPTFPPNAAALTKDSKSKKEMDSLNYIAPAQQHAVAAGCSLPEMPTSLAYSTQEIFEKTMRPRLLNLPGKTQTNPLDSFEKQSAEQIRHIKEHFNESENDERVKQKRIDRDRLIMENHLAAFIEKQKVDTATLAHADRAATISYTEKFISDQAQNFRAIIMEWLPKDVRKEFKKSIELKQFIESQVQFYLNMCKELLKKEPVSLHPNHPIQTAIFKFQDMLTMNVHDKIERDLAAFIDAQNKNITDSLASTPFKAVRHELMQRLKIKVTVLRTDKDRMILMQEIVDKLIDEKESDIEKAVIKYLPEDAQKKYAEAQTLTQYVKNLVLVYVQQCKNAGTSESTASAPEQPLQNAMIGLRKTIAILFPA